jgi:ferredoxin-NADP reductase
VTPRLLSWRVATVVGAKPESARAKAILLHVPGWPGHLAGQHLDLRLTAEDGYQAERSYSISSAPNGQPQIEITVERVDDGEVSAFLLDELRGATSSSCAARSAAISPGCRATAVRSCSSAAAPELHR